jgi:hypothetical protein
MDVPDHRAMTAQILDLVNETRPRPVMRASAMCAFFHRVSRHMSIFSVQCLARHKTEVHSITFMLATFKVKSSERWHKQECLKQTIVERLDMARHVIRIRLHSIYITSILLPSSCVGSPRCRAYRAARRRCCRFSQLWPLWPPISPMLPSKRRGCVSQHCFDL